MKNILYINNVYPIFEKGDSGASNRSTMFITALASIAYVDVISFVGEQVSTIDNCRIVYNEDCPMVRTRSRIDKIRKILTPWNIYSIFPLNSVKADIIDNFIKSHHYDYIAIRYINEVSECGLWKYADKLILDIDDNPFNALKNSAKHSKTIRNKIYSYIFAFLAKNAINHNIKKVKFTFYSNPNELPSDKSVYLHNVAMCDTIVSDITEETPIQILLIGTYHYAPNKEGLIHFLTHIYPKIRTAIPNVNLHVIGKIYDNELKKQLEKEPNLTLMGYVNNLASEYEQARLSIVPLYSGSGTSIKLIESMSMNRTCVATSVGVRGMENILNMNEDFLLAENDEQFADQIINSICDISLLNKISHNAKRKVNLYLSKTKFIEIIQKTIL